MTRRTFYWFLATALLVAGMGGILPASAEAGAAAVDLAIRTTLTRHEWVTLTIGMFGGISLMLYGIDKMGAALKIIAGDKMKQVMWRLTSNRLSSLLTGAFVTMVVQSSTVTTVLVVGFISSRLMSLAQAMGVILGADIGTTFTAQILAFKVSDYALLPVAIGFLLKFVSRHERHTQLGHAIMGIGLVFFGIDLMSQSMFPLRTYAPFMDIIASLSNPFAGIAVGAIFTILTNSSAATLALVIALASQGLLPLDVGIALTLGANIGTCLTAGLVAMGKSREAMRAAAAHVLFKVLGVALVLPVMPWFTEFVVYISPMASGHLGNAAAVMADTVPRQVANAHTMFNVVLALLFLPFSGQLARFLTWAIPDRPLNDEEVQPEFLDPFLLSTPTLALQATRSEISRMGKQVVLMLQQVLPAVLAGHNSDLKDIEKLDDHVDSLYSHIVAYLGRISQMNLTEKQTNEMLGLTYATHHLENIGDVIEINMVNAGRQRLQDAVVVSDETQKILMTIHQVLNTIIQDALKSVSELDRDSAERVINMKKDFKAVVNKAIRHLTQRLAAAEKNRVPTFSVEMDLIDKMQQIYYHCSRLAKCSLSIIDADQPRSF